MKIYSFELNGANNDTLLQRLSLIINKRKIKMKRFQSSENHDGTSYHYLISVETTEDWALQLYQQFNKQIDVFDVKWSF